MKFALTLFFLFFSFSARAEEPLFGYVYTTDLLPKQKWELEQWFTDREGQAHGRFHHIDMSTEVEYGVTDSFQASMYLNYMYADEQGNSVNGLTEGIEIPASHDAHQTYRGARWDGVSFELVYRVLSPYLNPVGLAFYVEPEFGPFEKGVELRAIVQKNYLDDLLVLAANLWVEFEKEVGSNLTSASDPGPADGAVAKATMAEVDLGASYRFKPNWAAGLEFRNHNEYAGYTLAHAAQDHTAFFLGPNIHYGAEKWFMTLSALYQLGAHPYTEDQAEQMYRGRLYGDEHTTWDGIRLKLGFPF